MAKNLVIVESPTKTRTLAKFLGKGYTVAATMGHLIDLPPKKLGVEIDDDFRPVYVPIEGKEKIVAHLKKEAKKAETIYLAPDPDREGEAIAWHVLSILKGTKATIKRASFNEITKSAVLAALESASTIDQHKVDAQQARRVLDRIVGYKVSPFLWKTVCRGLSAGRVQSVALRLVCERESEIVAFNPQEYWTIDVDLHKTSDRKKLVFTAAISAIDGDKVEVQKEESARSIETDLKRAKYQVAAVTKQKRSRRPQAPHVTSTLQQDAAGRLRYSPKRTMKLAQELYEGVDLGNQGSVGLITYMRTDSTRVSKEAQTAARKLIKKEYGAEYCPEKPNVYASKKRSQDAHEAIRPTYFNLSPDSIRKNLSPSQFKLYTLIWNRFLASQMSPAQIERLSIDISAVSPPAKDKAKKAHTYTLKTGVEKVVFPGFLKVFEDAPVNGNDEEEIKKLPTLADDDTLTFVDIDTAQHWTKPPPRFSEATLVRELEANGIGRPSTYAQILATILARNYVFLDERRLAPTDLGKTVNSILVDAFPELFDVAFTAEMENKLDRIEEGTKSWTDIMKAFYGPFANSLDDATARAEEIKESHRETLDEKCPECSEPLIVRWSRSGKFVACSGYPECRYTSDHSQAGGGAAPVVETDEKCDKCSSPMVIKTGRFGQFLACSAYPKCKSTRSIPTGVSCPEEGCEGDLVPRRTRGGRTFYSCSKYPQCKHAVWDRPVPHACPQCSSPFMLAKNTKAQGEHFKCPACKHSIPAELLSETAAA